MNTSGLTKDQIKKITLSAMGFVFLLYVYFTFFLGPLGRSRKNMEAQINDKQSKLDASKGEMSKAATLEHQAKTATAQFAALKGLNSEGAPIAWFPPRLKVFFANEQIDKAGARQETATAFKEPELSGWMKYSWLVEIPQADYAALGKAIADLENAEPLLTVTKLTIRAQTEQPQFQTVDFVATNYIQKDVQKK
jgi:hypothetical protein